MDGLATLIPEELRSILQQTPELERTYLVGGGVRDWLLGIPSKDFDLEVFGVDFETLARALGGWGKTNPVGRSFGVIKLTAPSGHVYDFTIPRRDSKIGPGHKGFESQFDPSITPEIAASRRDFTINSLLLDPQSGEVLDFFGGLKDLQNRILRHTSPAFIEDPLRVLRGMQFSARFDLAAAPETVELCRTIKSSYSELAGDRVREEWFKWAQRSVRPSAGLRFLAASGWLEHFPEIHALQAVPQDPAWHPEGDVFTHTCHCCDALVRLPEWQAADAESKTVYSLAVLAHDFGKPQTTSRALKDGQFRIVSPGHEEAGGPLADQFLARIHAPTSVRERVIPLVTHHLAHLNPLSDRALRRLAKRLEPETINGLCVVMIADHFGRPPKPKVIPEPVLALQRTAAELQVQAGAPKPILMGRHLLELELPPGPFMGKLLKQAFEAQLDGRILDLDQAYRWLADQSIVALPPAAYDRLKARGYC